MSARTVDLSPMKLTEDQIQAQKNAIAGVDGSATYAVGVSIDNYLGKVRLNGFNTGAVGRYDFIGLYTDNFPSDPNSNLKAYQYVSNSLPYDTDQTYGPGYLAAYVAYDYKKGRYVYLAQTPKT